MRVCVFASGSDGNCLLVSGEDTNILVDFGISMRRVVSSLAQLGIDTESINGVLITHEHSDHIKGLPMFLKHHQVPAYAPRTVRARMIGMYPDLEDAVGVIPVWEEFYIGSIAVRAFHTPHDTDESVGYRFDCGDGSFAVATDMGKVTEEIESAVTGCDTVLIEANHDEDMLCTGRYPVSLKRRILSDHGHLSNAECAKFVRRLVAGGTERVILGHLSRENNTPVLALDTVKNALGEAEAEVYCAPVSGCLTVYTGRRVCSR